jgi:hypothetical protein
MRTPYTLILGEVGSGKTLFLVWNALCTLDNEIWANIYIKHPRFKRLQIEDFIDIPIGVDIFIDEGYRLLESRRAMNSFNLHISEIKEQRRKTNSAWYITAQFQDLIDVRFANRYNKRVDCRTRYNDTDDFHYRIEHVIANKPNILEHKKIEYNDAKHHLFPYFHTFEKVHVENRDKREYDLIKDDAEKIWDKIQEYIPLIENDYENGIIAEYTKDLVDYSCMRHKIYHKYAWYLWKYLNGKIKFEQQKEREKGKNE